MALLPFLAAQVVGQNTSSNGFVCQSGAAAVTQNASFTALGCYNDSTVSILSASKLSSIAMTPQFCANYCSGKGYAYGGINFGTQCFCGQVPNLAGNNKLSDSNCSQKCTTDPSQSCGATYKMSLLQINSPQSNASTGSASTAFTPACQTSPLCSQKICNTSLSITERVNSLINSFTLEEKILNLVDASAGSSRLGLPPYEWWNEGTHGVGSAPGVQFPNMPANFSYATSFPSPILYAAAFDDDLIRAIGNVVGREGRAFGNNGFAGFDYWTPNMNEFRDPRWGRGQETPGEDAFHVSSYVRNFVPGLQGDSLNDKQIIATCKHYAVYDLETGRYGNDYNPSAQDLSEYYLAAFKACVRDAKVGSIMCSYNAVDGVPSCANDYLLQDILRNHWNFTADYQYVVSDCGAVTDIWQYHNYTNTEEAAASVALNAGTDLECGSSYIKLNQSVADNQTTIARMDQALGRLYQALFTVGFFDGSAYQNLDWADVATPDAQDLAYRAAVEGMVLLKNDGFLPQNDTSRVQKVAVIGPYANATTQMQGDYSGTAKYLRSPLEAFNNYDGFQVLYAEGTAINTNSTGGFAAALTAARQADFIIYLGGIDNSLEAETLDRLNLTWPGNQLDLVGQLANLSKPVTVVRFGGGQCDDSPLLSNPKVNSLIWAGYPSQSGGPALLDILTGAQSIAGRLPTTEYPASYVDEVSIYNINLRPNGSYPGRTYRWYTGTPVLPFGFGLSYTTFDFAWKKALRSTYNIQDVITQLSGSLGDLNDVSPFGTITAIVTNTGRVASDYVGLLFISSDNAGPVPRPIKTLVAYDRLHNVAVNGNQVLSLPLTLGSLARADENGNTVIYPGDYTLALDNDKVLTFNFTLTGQPATIETMPAPAATYNTTVPVHIQPPSMQAYS
ncbi:hypothetical protein MBLNU457_2201t2 [Dothideomycetes sp. NU457]